MAIPLPTYTKEQGAGDKELLITQDNKELSSTEDFHPGETEAHGWDVVWGLWVGVPEREMELEFTKVFTAETGPTQQNLFSQICHLRGLLM